MTSSCLVRCSEFPVPMLAVGQRRSELRAPQCVCVRRETPAGVHPVAHAERRTVVFLAGSSTISHSTRHCNPCDVSVRAVSVRFGGVLRCLCTAHAAHTLRPARTRCDRCATKQTLHRETPPLRWWFWGPCELLCVLRPRRVV